ncbi:MAG: hypothetical protein HZA14_12440 [Nitrospirae bacterium]|nr:hypothetical protein [Nitrospirota bacterium]
MSLTITIKTTPELGPLIQRLGNDINGGMKAGMIKLVGDIRANAVKKTPVGKEPGKRGNLVNSIVPYISDNGLFATLKATAPYAEYVHEGTGLFGPLHHLIVPKKAKALFIPGVGFRKSTKGMKGRPFFNLALKDFDAQKSFEQGIQNYLTKRGW